MNPPDYIGFSLEDRDRLVRLEETVRSLVKDVKEMKDDMKEQIADHESRLRFIERYMWLAIGAVGVLQFIIKYFL